MLMLLPWYILYLLNIMAELTMYNYLVFLSLIWQPMSDSSGSHQIPDKDI